LRWQGGAHPLVDVRLVRHVVGVDLVAGLDALVVVDDVLDVLGGREGVLAVGRVDVGEGRGRALHRGAAPLVGPARHRGRAVWVGATSPETAPSGPRDQGRGPGGGDRGRGAAPGARGHLFSRTWLHDIPLSASTSSLLGSRVLRALARDLVAYWWVCGGAEAGGAVSAPAMFGRGSGRVQNTTSTGGPTSADTAAFAAVSRNRRVHSG
jgi:hypothetical protein